MSDPPSAPQVPPIPLVPAAMLHALTVAHAEIARLRMTDAEREAFEAAVGRSNRIGTEYAIIDADVLRGFLERHRGVSE